MIDPGSYSQVRAEIAERVREDRQVLEQLRAEIRLLRSQVRRIQARTTTSISLVGTDGGNNRIEFDPFLVQLIRVVDSSNNEYCLEAVTPSTKVAHLSELQFEAEGGPTALGRLMSFLGVSDLTKLSHMIRSNEDGRPLRPSWVQVYRELVEWAVLFSIIREKEFGADTLIVFDGLLRSKVFAGTLFARLLKGLHDAMEMHRSRHRRNLYLVGLAKHSKVLTRYRLAMALEGILTSDFPAYVEIPREIETKVYRWDEYARGSDVESEGGEVNKFVGGKMFFAKFGNRSRDPIWPVDIFLPQRVQASVILGYLLADAQNGFPVPLYPLCLQKAHENAALVEFDFDILQDEILAAIRGILEDEAPVVDIARLGDMDPASARYA